MKVLNGSPAFFGLNLYIIYLSGELIMIRWLFINLYMCVRGPGDKMAFSLLSDWELFRLSVIQAH